MEKELEEFLRLVLSQGSTCDRCLLLSKLFARLQGQANVKEAPMWGWYADDLRGTAIKRK